MADSDIDSLDDDISNLLNITSDSVGDDALTMATEAKTRQIMEIHSRFIDEVSKRTDGIFKHRVYSFPSYEKTKFLILLTMPQFDEKNNVAVMDYGDKITKYFDDIFEPGICSVLTCTFGHNGNRWATYPTVNELKLSIPYLIEMIQVINPVCIFTVDSLPAELCRCMFDLPTFFKTINPRVNEPYPESMTGAVQLGDIDSFIFKHPRIASNTNTVCRYLMLPRFSLTGMAFYKAIVANMERFNHLIRSPINPRPVNVFEVSPNFSPDYMHYYYDTATCVSDILSPTNTLHQSRRYIQNLQIMDDCYRNIDYVYMRDLEYDEVSNVMHMFGTTMHGHPVLVDMCNISFTFGFTPHEAFSMDLTRQTSAVWTGYAENLEDHDLDPLRNELKSKLKWVLGYKVHKPTDVTIWIDHAHIFNESQHYTLRPIIMCRVIHYNYIKAVSNLLRKLITKWPCKTKQLFSCIEVFSPELMFSITYKYKLSHWYRFDRTHRLGFYKTAASESSYVRQYHTLIEYSDENPPMVCLAPEQLEPIIGEYTSNDAAPQIEIVMDIECTNNDQRFPDPFRDAVICICNVVVTKNNKNDPVLEKVFIPVSGYLYVNFALGYARQPSNPNHRLAYGDEVTYCFYNEADLLMSYFYWIRYMMGDYMFGHNFKSFDLQYLHKRASVLGLNLPACGRLDDAVFCIDKRKFASRAHAERIVVLPRGIPGMMLLDLLEILYREEKLPTYTLNYVARTNLGQQKNDMPYAALYGMWTYDPDTFRLVVEYCSVDSRLVAQLMTQKMWVPRSREQTRIIGAISEEKLYEVGMQAKVSACIMFIKALRPPDKKVVFTTPDTWSATQNDSIVESWTLSRKNDEGKEEDKKRVIWASVNNELLRKRSRIDANTDEILSSSSVQITLDCNDDTEEIALITEEEFKERVKRHKTLITKSKKLHASGKKLTQVEIDAQDLKIIKANGGREGPIKERKKGYDGAVVMDVPLGFFHRYPALCMDFTGLYPSIMMAHNIGEAHIFESERMVGYIIPFDDLHCPPDCEMLNPRTGKKEVYYFVKKERWPSVLAETEFFLKDKRDKTKEAMTAAFKKGDKTLGSNYNAAQLAIKLIMNSIYGACGAASGVLSLVLAANAVTAWGRHYIMMIRGMLEKLCGAICAGGDTDSVFMMLVGILVDGMLKFRVRNLEEANIFGPWICKNVLNPTLPYPMSLDFEKTMLRALLVAKKRYAYWHCEGFKTPYIHAKGMETVRRDTTTFTKTTLRHIQEVALQMPRKDISLLLYPRPTMENPFTKLLRYSCTDYGYNDWCVKEGTDPFSPTSDEHLALIQAWQAMTPEQRKIEVKKLQAQWQADEDEYYRLDAIDVESYKQQVIEYIREQGCKLITGQVPLTQCIQSKQYSKEFYKNTKQPHLTVIAKRIARGHPPPNLGDRIKFVYIVLPKDSKTDPGKTGKLKKRKAYQCAEDPEYAIANNLEIDWEYYFENTFVKPIVRFTRFLLKDEMIERIRKSWAPPKQNSFFQPTRLDPDGNPLPIMLQHHASTSRSSEPQEKEITIDDIHDATMRFLFFMPPKNSPLNRDVHTRYPKFLGGRKRVNVKTCDKDISPIAHANFIKQTELERIQEIHKTVDIEDLHRLVVDEFKQASDTYTKCLKVCQDCIKQEEVQCGAHDCPDYFPRVYSKGVYTRAQAALNVVQDAIPEGSSISYHSVVQSII
jgi:DNA polymerase elongation subunit (family B)